jgi:hypothetical protein
MTASLLLLLALAAAEPAQAGAAPPTRVADAGEKAADDPNKVICKKFLETGSLVKSTRVCKTKIEWQRGRDDVRSRMTMNGQQSCGGGNGVNCF